jgi:hypothetical protein
VLHAPVVLAARMLVVDDNESDVFLLDRALSRISRSNWSTY